MRPNYRKIENQKSFYQYMKKDQGVPNKNNLSNNGSRKPLPDKYNTSRQQPPYRNNYRGTSPDRRFHEISHKTDLSIKQSKQLKSK